MSHKSKGVTYIYYSYGWKHNPKKKYTVPKCTSIGKCNYDSDMMYPNTNYIKFYPTAELPETKALEFGHQNEDCSKTVINYSVAYDRNNSVPLYYEDYPGSIVDIAQLYCMLEKVGGYKNIGFILDRGYFVIITSEIMTAAEALDLYKSRDVSEKLFCMDKTFLENKSLRTHTGESVHAKIVIEFVALIIINRLYKGAMYQKRIQTELHDSSGSNKGT